MNSKDTGMTLFPIPSIGVSANYAEETPKLSHEDYHDLTHMKYDKDLDTLFPERKQQFNDGSSPEQLENLRNRLFNHTSSQELGNSIAQMGVTDADKAVSPFNQQSMSITDNRPEVMPTNFVKGMDIRKITQSRNQEITKEYDHCAAEANKLKADPLTAAKAKSLAISEYFGSEYEKVKDEFKQLQLQRAELNEREQKNLAYGKDNGLDTTLWRHAPGIFKGEGLKYYEAEKANIEKSRAELGRKDAEIKNKIDQMNEKLKSPEAREFVSNRIAAQLEQDKRLQKERAEKLETMEKRMNELSAEKKQIESFNKFISYKLFNKDFKLEGDKIDFNNILSQSDSLKQQSVELMQQIQPQKSQSRSTGIAL